MKTTAVPLPIENIDTDQIIPARFLKATERKGFGENLFRDWKYRNDNTIISDFVLNNPIYKGKILCTPCGACRQRIREFGSKETEIIICNEEGVEKIFTIEDLLPQNFGPDNLN